MLPEPLRLLVSAFAAGDLSPRRRKAAVRLLRHSREARQLLRELKVNRQRLRSLRSPSLPADFADRVLAALPPEANRRDRQSKPAVAPIIRPSPLTAAAKARRPFPLPWAVAAAVLLAVTVGTGVYISRPDAPSAAQQDVARVDSPDPPAVAQSPPRDDPAEEFVPAPPEFTLPDLAVAKDPPPASERPAPKQPSADPLGNVPLPAPELVRVAPPRLLTLAVRALDDEQARKRLQQELSKADAHHIDLFCHDATKGFDRLRAALRARGVRLIVDGLAQESLKRKLQAQYLVYCDDLTAGQWTQLLRRLGSADKQPEEPKAGTTVFDHVVILGLDAADRREVTTLFGSDLTRPAPQVGAGGIEARRPPGESAPPATASGTQPEPKSDAKVAMVASLAPWRTPPGSKQVRQFLDARHDRGPGTVAVLLTLRTVNN